MTRKEKDRSFLRAFGAAARMVDTCKRVAIFGGISSEDRAFFVYRAHAEEMLGSRRQVQYEGSFAHSLASAWGL